MSRNTTSLDPEHPLVRYRETNNPYFTGWYFIRERLKWDVYIDAWRSRRKLQKLKNSHCGEKAVILCNGPSLLETDFNELRKSCVYTFGLNKINLLFDKEEFRPDCIVSVNQLVLSQNSDFFNSTDILLFLDAYARKKNIVDGRANVVYLHSSGVPRFAKDVSISIIQGNTVTFVALQLAFHMGFQEISIVGADHSFAVSGPPNKKIKADAIDQSHFDPRYFSGDMEWQLPDLFESEVWYGRAHKVYKAHGRKIFNSTVGGKLEVFPRLSLREFLMKEN
jgi:hypothetical protein